MSSKETLRDRIIFLRRIRSQVELGKESKERRFLIGNLLMDLEIDTDQLNKLQAILEQNTRLFIAGFQEGLLRELRAEMSPESFFGCWILLTI